MVPVRWRKGRSMWGADATHVDLMDAGGRGWLLLISSLIGTSTTNCGAHFSSGAQFLSTPFFAYQIEVCCHCVWPPLPHIDP